MKAEECELCHPGALCVPTEIRLRSRSLGLTSAMLWVDAAMCLLYSSSSDVISLWVM